jgi:hypothetical protein
MGLQGLKELLRIPADVEIVALTPVGYHDEPAKARPEQVPAAVSGFTRGDSRALGRLLRGRLPRAEIAHDDGW